MVGSFSHLSVCALTPDMHSRTCNYWYVVQDRASPHTAAFTYREDLIRWLEDRGLIVEGFIPKAQSGEWKRIIGTYHEEYHYDEKEFYALPATRDIRVLDNGKWTLGRIVLNADDTRTVHVLNPNVKDRPLYDLSSDDELRSRGMGSSAPVKPVTRIYRNHYGLIAETIIGDIMVMTMRRHGGLVSSSLSRITDRHDGMTILEPIPGHLKTIPYEVHLTQKKLGAIHAAHLKEYAEEREYANLPA